MLHPTSGCVDARPATCPCPSCDLLLGLDGVHVEHVDRSDGLLIVTVSSPPSPTGCPSCGVVAASRGRRRRVLHDVPGGTRVRVVWRQRVFRCGDAGCARKSFVEQIPSLVAARGSIAKRAIRWAVGQQDTLGHRGRKGDPLYGIQSILRAGAENLTERQRARLAKAIEADPAHDEVFVAWQCAQQLRSAYHQKDLVEGRRIAEKVVESFRSCPIPEIARLGRTLRRWRPAFLAYFTTGRSSNGGTEAVNGIIELHRRLARGYRNRNNYRLRMLLAAGGLTP